MELMYSSEATDKQFAQRNIIIERSNRNGYVTTEDAKWLMDFDRKYRRCNKCGKSLSEAKQWGVVKAKNRNCKELDAGLHEVCFHYAMEDIIKECDKGKL
jgi:phage FluMu protein Com